MEFKHYTQSSIIKYNYQALCYPMFQLASEKEYMSFAQYADEFEQFIMKELSNRGIEVFRHPDALYTFGIEQEQEYILFPEHLDGTGEELPFLICQMTSYHPLKHTEKPSGIIFEDFSFLQIDQTLAFNPQEDKIYIIFYSYHYGRIRDGKEVYFFRYDKESNYEWIEGELIKRAYKPEYHFHGNSDDPHFPDTVIDWKGKVRHILEILATNLTRLRDKYKDCDYLS